MIPNIAEAPIGLIKNANTNTPGAVLDSAGMLNILQAALGSGTRVKLTGITGDSTEAEIADAVFPVITTDGKRYLTRIKGQNIIARKATNCIMSLAVLMKAGYDVKFRVNLYVSKAKRARAGFQCMSTSFLRCRVTVKI